MGDGHTMQPFHVRTPLLESIPLSNQVGLPVYLKCENCQPSGSFKIRGIGHLIQESYDSGSRHVIIASGGNAGLAAAYAAHRLGIQATVFIPESCPASAIAKLEEMGATVVVAGRIWDECHEEAFKFASGPGRTYVHPFDHPLIWQGHSSMIREIRDQLDGVKPRAVVVAVGGGGLLLGVVQGLKDVGWSDVPIIAMETEGAASFRASIKAKELVTLHDLPSIAICLSVKTVAKRAFECAKNQEHPIYSYVVSDEEALQACHQLLDQHRFLVEPACGAGMASAYSGVLTQAWEDGYLLNSGPIVIVVCGGALTSLELLDKWQDALRSKPT